MRASSPKLPLLSYFPTHTFALSFSTKISYTPLEMIRQTERRNHYTMDKVSSSYNMWVLKGRIGLLIWTAYTVLVSSFFVAQTEVPIKDNMPSPNWAKCSLNIIKKALCNLSLTSLSHRNCLHRLLGLWCVPGVWPTPRTCRPKPPRTAPGRHQIGGQQLAVTHICLECEFLYIKPFKCQK